MNVSTATSDSSPTTSLSNDAPLRSAEPRTKVISSVPVGYPRTAAGAKAAASNFTVVMGSWPFLTEAGARRSALSVMTANSAPKAVAEKADRTARQAARGLQNGNHKLDRNRGIARTGVLSARTLGFDIHRATVRLWTTAVRGSAVGHRAPATSYRSVTVSLVWENNDWKLYGGSEQKGLVAPIDFRQSTNSASSFADYVPGNAADPVLSGSVGQDGFPARYRHTEQGARGAATSAVALWGDPRFFTSSEWRHHMLAATAAPSSLRTLTSDTDATAALVRENRALGEDGTTADGGLLVTRTAALATRAVSYSDRAASIEVWTASVGGVAGPDETQTPQCAFLRMTVDLTWSGGTWTTTAVTPSEPLVPAPPADPASHSSSFAGVGGVADAPPTA
ncbi:MULTISPECIES: hypothetical protein [Streptomyces]|uniref:Integral membrane protein n=1 Tax=Streptomyces ramulosus TaxID=47762 RepID=A0ABW1FMS1_9ACTN